MDKIELRKKYINIRKNILDKKEKSEAIFNRIIQREEYKHSKIIGLYKNLPSEVDTNGLIEYSLHSKIVLLPKVNGNDIEFYRILDNCNYIKSDFGIYEPNNKEVYNGIIDLLLVPGICFDKNKDRIGFGKGYYDRFLYNKSIKTIGICFDEQITDEVIETSEYDKKLDMIITDKRIIK